MLLSELPTFGDIAKKDDEGSLTPLDVFILSWEPDGVHAGRSFRAGLLAVVNYCASKPGAPPPLVFPTPGKLTREELFEQRVSWAYSCVAGDGITKDQVRRVLAASSGEVK